MLRVHGPRYTLVGCAQERRCYIDDTDATYRDVGKGDLSGTKIACHLCRSPKGFASRHTGAAIYMDNTHATCREVSKGRFVCNKNHLPRVFGTYTANQGHIDTTII